MSKASGTRSWMSAATPASTVSLDVPPDAVAEPCREDESGRQPQAQVAAVVAGLRLPVRRATRDARSSRRRGPAGRSGAIADDVAWAPDVDDWWVEEERDLAAFRPIAGTQVILALTPMSVLKAALGSRCASAAIEACARCAAENASST